jgi:hypothetical protein
VKKIIIGLLLVFFLFAAYSSKPDDKTCIIAAVKYVWGSRVPDDKVPMYYEQFMDLTSQSVKVNDLIFFKSIQYKVKNDYKTVGFGAFKRVFTP